MTGNPHHRISGQYLWESFLKAFDLEKGLIFTIRELTVRPAQAIGDYLNGSRRLFNPIKYAILAMAVYEIKAFVSQKLNPPHEDDFTFTHTLIGFVIGLILFSLVFYLLNHKKGYNFFEYLVAATFVGAQLFLSYVLVQIFALMGLDHRLVLVLWLVLVLIYVYWIVRSLFKLSVFMTILSMGLPILASMTYSFLIRFSEDFADLTYSIRAFFE